MKTGFETLGIDHEILSVLDKLKFTVPTPIQAKAIPIAVSGRDVIGIAQTGTGKTLAFAVPMVQKIIRDKSRALVLVPTRELAIQVNETVKKLAAPFGLKSAVVIGGVGMQPQTDALRSDTHIIIATPGRLIDHMERGSAKLGNIDYLVLDEADRMLDMGFLRPITEIIKAVNKKRQTMLFSATMPGDIVKIASEHMKLPVSTEIAPQGTKAETVSQEIFVIKQEMKSTLLLELVKQYEGTVLVFTRTKRGADRAALRLKKAGVTAAEIHSDLSMGQRKNALEGFKSGRYRVLVATDIAARGIDVTDIEVVINYDLPEDASNYVHRIGRTGRAGKTGHAISLATPEQGAEVKAIENLIKAVIPVSRHGKVQHEGFTGVPKNPLPKPFSDIRPPKFDRHGMKKKYRGRG